ncbi:uncharacterized protein LOC119671761 isoform X2 [Teleopsis dalmanni]|uniref:uncharacterized protein LOC119671761 isoform X2 n=1 Tax=Teleopsis dalmanni TaxID=139649 RepID=UPI0018CF3108|nr:uncharacterized protein LOC119671761 isoform X2 [Teleopsis dalmanni]
MYCAQCRTRLVATHDKLVGLYRCSSGHLVCEKCTKEANGSCGVCGTRNLRFTSLNSMFPVTKFATSNQNQNDTSFSSNDIGTSIYPPPLKSRTTSKTNIGQQYKQCGSVQTNAIRNVGGGSIADSVPKSIKNEILSCATEIVRLCRAQFETDVEEASSEPVPPPRVSSYGTPFEQRNPQSTVPPVPNFQHPNLQVPPSPYYPLNLNQAVPTIPYTSELSALLVENQRLQGANTELLQALNTTNQETAESVQSGHYTSSSSVASEHRDQKFQNNKRTQCSNSICNYAKQVERKKSSHLNAEESYQMNKVHEEPCTSDFKELVLENKRLKSRNKKLIIALNNANQESMHSKSTSHMPMLPGIRSQQEHTRHFTNNAGKSRSVQNHVMDMRNKDSNKTKVQNNHSAKTYTVCKGVRKRSPDPAMKAENKVKEQPIKNHSKNKLKNVQEIPARNEESSFDSSDSECNEVFYQLKNKLPNCHVKGSKKNKHEPHIRRQNSRAGGMRKKTDQHSDVRLQKLISVMHEGPQHSKSVKLARAKEAHSTISKDKKEINIDKTRNLCRKMYRTLAKQKAQANDEVSDSPRPLRETYTKSEMAKMASQVARAKYIQSKLSIKVVGRKLLTDPNPIAQFDIMEYPLKSISSLELLAAQRKCIKTINAKKDILPLHPFPCSEGHCKMHVFSADFTKHVHNDHSYLHTDRLLPRTYRNFFININEALCDAPRSHYLYLVKNKIRNLGTLVFQDVLPLLIMTARLRLSDMIECDEQISPAEDIDFLIIWMCGLEPESRPLGATLAIWKPAVERSKCHFVYSGRIFKAAHNTTTLNVYKSGKCILLTPQQQRALLVRDQFLQMQIYVH